MMIKMNDGLICVGWAVKSNNPIEMLLIRQLNDWKGF